ncbi:hypothetical protein CYY_003239 [Polysphondylium violaceum]|uniref:asparagine--tRNA ligase n=1 Tax=Polysphondylium violaceum TaxID=133409 RepID=A0A8J4PWR0_9MYCE|nr:hypothetical protein CYY_003239 [Polysphondylium violaceum]
MMNLINKCASTTLRSLGQDLHSKRFYQWPLRIKDIQQQSIDANNNQITIQGWVRNVRHQKSISFLEINDGSSIAHLQVVAENPESLKGVKHGACVSVTGNLVQSKGKNAELKELNLESIKVIGDCPEDFPLQPKLHSMEFLREIAHFRTRSNTLGAVLRVRNRSTQLIHNYFNRHGFINVHTPIITAGDCEGGGEQFHVSSTVPPPPTSTTATKNTTPTTNTPPPFFGEKAYLTVSGQLEAEIFASSHGRVYTFGPTFRAEKSNTSRHLSEFWMIEPEIAFINLTDNLDIAEDFVKYLVKNILIECKDDIDFFNKRVDKNLLARLEKTVASPFIRLPYKDAIQLLLSAKEKFENPVSMGIDLAREHEKYITNHYDGVPVFITHWPKNIKPFYMRESEEDSNTVENMDLLVPEIGELIGGSIREERFDHLHKRMSEMGMNIDGYDWYNDLRKYGSAPHGGFGLGFERFLQYVTGLQNIRDVIPIPRYPGFCKF